MERKLLPISTDVRDFLYRDVYPATERRIVRLFRSRFQNEEEYDQAHEDIYEYLMQHIVQTEQRTIMEDKEEGKQLKTKRLESKMSKLRCILFEGEEEEETQQDEMISLMEHLEIKEKLENLLLEARDEIVALNHVLRGEVPPLPLEGGFSPLTPLKEKEGRRASLEIEKENKERTSGEGANGGASPMKNEEGGKGGMSPLLEEFDADYVGVNTMLNELAALREIRRRHGTIHMEGRASLEGGSSPLTPLCEEKEEEEGGSSPLTPLCEEKEEEEGGSSPLTPLCEEKEEEGGTSPLENDRENKERISGEGGKGGTSPLEQGGKGGDSPLLECPICYCELNTDPESPDYTGCCIGQFCGHALCETCWKAYRRRRNKICPVCKQLLFMGRGRPPKAIVW